MRNECSLLIFCLGCLTADVACSPVKSESRTKLRANEQKSDDYQKQRRDKLISFLDAHSKLDSQYENWTAGCN
jgi:hypothetical protein